MIRVGTRGSALARAQAAIVMRALGGELAMTVVRTAGDASERPLRELGEGIFVAALERALRAGEIDVAVHSLKDLPTVEADDLVVAAVPTREDVRDVLVTSGRGGLDGLPRGAAVGTSSPRRAAFIAALRPDVRCREIRGNVETRMRRVRDGEYDATILAAAGLRRLGIPFDERELLPVASCPPAPGQGALAAQTRASDVALRERVAAALDDRATHAAVSAERALLRLLGASCEIPLGCHARWLDGVLVLDAALATGAGVARTSVRGGDPLELAARAASELGVVAGA